MKNIYFTRHGETVWNVEHKICGRTDVSLTERGIAQAEELGKRIKAEAIYIDEILCSPLTRAATTARIIADITGLPLRSEPRLIEQSFGSFEGKDFRNEDFRLSKMRFADRYGDGESMLRLAARIYPLLDELKQDEKIYLLVAHNGIARVVNSYFNDVTNEEYADYGIKNCELMCYGI